MVSYQREVVDGSNPVTDLRVMHCNDANCDGGDDSITSPDSEGDVGWFTSLELDSSGNPVIGYTITRSDLRVMHCNDPNCEGGDDSITAPDTAGDVGYDTSLALDAAGHPVVSYCEFSFRFSVCVKLKILHCNDPNCAGGDESITAPDVTLGAGAYTSLTLDGSGNPVVTYVTDDLRVLHCGDPSCGAGKEPPTPTRTPTRTATPTRTPTLEKALGDVNGDGQVNSIDALLALQFVAGLIGSAPNADTNEDGSVNSIDALLILQLVAGLIDSLPP